MRAMTLKIILAHFSHVLMLLLLIFFVTLTSHKKTNHNLLYTEQNALKLIYFSQNSH